MQQSKTHCPFCDQSQNYRYILTTEEFLLMYPKNPDCAYHVLIIPKKHITLLSELPRESFTGIGALIKKLDSTMRQKMPKDYLGFNLLSNNGGPEVNQAIPHAHVHMFLRTKQDKHDPIIEHVTRPIKELSEVEKGYLKQLKEWIN